MAGLSVRLSSFGRAARSAKPSDSAEGAMDDLSDEVSELCSGWREQSLLKDLETFEPQEFQAEKYLETKCGTMNEKALKRLGAQLKQHSQLSLEDMRATVFANYAAFIRP